MTMTSFLKPTSQNSPSIVRSSFLLYLRTGFPYQQPWRHPCSNIEYGADLIQRRLSEFKKINPKGYRAFWYLWTCQGTRSTVATNLMISGTTLKRLWDKSTDTLILMLLFPDLTPECYALENKL